MTTKEIFEKSKLLMNLKEQKEGFEKIFEVAPCRNCFNVTDNGWYRISLPTEKIMPVIQNEYNELKERILILQKELGVDEL